MGDKKRGPELINFVVMGLISMFVIIVVLGAYSVVVSEFGRIKSKNDVINKAPEIEITTIGKTGKGHVISHIKINKTACYIIETTSGDVAISCDL